MVKFNSQLNSSICFSLHFSFLLFPLFLSFLLSLIFKNTDWLPITSHLLMWTIARQWWKHIKPMHSRSFISNGKGMPVGVDYGGSWMPEAWLQQTSPNHLWNIPKPNLSYVKSLGIISNRYSTCKVVSLTVHFSSLDDSSLHPFHSLSQFQPPS